MLEAQQFQNFLWLVRLPGNLPNHLSPHSFGVLHISMKQALGPLAVKMTSAFSGQGAVERYHKSNGLHRDRYSNLKQPDTVAAKIKAAQIFQRNKESQSKSKPNVLDTSKDLFDEMAAVRAEREEAVRTLALARACTDEDEDAEADLEFGRC